MTALRRLRLRWWGAWVSLASHLPMRCGAVVVIAGERCRVTYYDAKRPRVRVRRIA